MTKALAKELGPSNIRVNAVAPGTIKTDMDGELSEEEIEELKKEIPLKRRGEPEEIAKGVKFLIENEYMTGQVITIDGRLDNLISKINCVLRCYSKSKNASTCKKHASAFLI